MKPIKMFAALGALALSFNAIASSVAPTVDVYKSPSCGCCGKWVKHMRHNGFQVRVHEANDVPAIRQATGMPDRLGSCHTAMTAGYVFEGHVPAADVRRLLNEKPKALGLAVPAMVPGSPGMESVNPKPYQTLLVQTDGTTQVFAQH